MTGSSLRNPPESNPGPDTDEAIAAIRDRADEIRERETETALTKLDARGDLSAADREAVEALAERLVDRLVAVPERGLRAADAGTAESRAPGSGSSDEENGGETDETIATALKLFG